MIRLGNFNVVLDACVLYDSHLRDLLLRLAEKELYQPIWSSLICEEVKRNLKKRISEDKVLYLIETMNAAFPEAVIDSFSELPKVEEDRVNIKDRHVLSAALLGNAQVIVTNNLKDFPNEALSGYNVIAQSPDEFLVNLFYLSFNKVFDAYIEMEKSFRNPLIKREELLKRFATRTPQFIELLEPHLANNIIRIY
jgi:predicted nucleic acid-binding protein